MFTRQYQKLIAWQEAHRLCLRVYRITLALPKDERFRLVDQMCRSAYSVPMNIAEGCNKKSIKERKHFYEISACSLEELHYQIFLSQDLEYLSEEICKEAQNHVGRTSYLLNRLRGIGV